MPLSDLVNFEAIISTSEVLMDLTKPHLYILKIKITFIDDSVLYVKEIEVFVDNRREYGYQWQRADNTLIIRWDNAHDYPNLPTSPFHKHMAQKVMYCRPNQ